jgi:hypothetical protein
MTRKRELRPFRQGQLDSLCGVYSVVNAVRLVMQQHQRMTNAQSGALFATLIADLAAKDLLEAVVANGAGLGGVARCVRHARMWLREEYGVELAVERPFTGQRRNWPTPPLTILRDHLQEPGRAAIVCTFFHWTVAHAVSRSTLRIFDSSGGSALRVTPIDETTCEPLFLPGTFLLSVAGQAED